MMILAALLVALAVAAYPATPSLVRLAETPPPRLVLQARAAMNGAEPDAPLASSRVSTPAGWFSWLNATRRRATPAPVTAHDVAAAADLLGLALASGHSVTGAVHAVAEVSAGAVRRDLTTVATAYQWGLTDAQAWSMVGDAWQPLAGAVSVSHATGTPLAHLMAEVAREVRAREDHRLATAAAALGVRMVLPLGCAFLPAFLATTVVPVVMALAQEVMR